MNITDLFLNNIKKFADREIPSSALHRAEQSLLDYIAVTSAGSKYNEEKLTKYFLEVKPETGNSTLIGMGRNINLKDSVFINGLNAHALDIDDGTNTGIIHLGSPIFSVLIPLAEKHNLKLKQVLKAAIIGYETSFTMAITIQPKHKLMGYHATGTCGVLGIAVAVSHLLDLSPLERRNSFSTAAVSASGLLKVLDDESELKPYNVAKSALLGLISVQMAKAGFMGPNDVLGGDRGYLRMMTGQSDLEVKEPLQNGTYAIEKTYTKPYAACRYCHPAIDAAIKLKQGIELSEIKNVHVKTYDLAVKGHDHTDVRSASSAKMSIPYSVAVALVKGKAGIIEYEDECINDKFIIDLTKKIRVSSDSRFSANFPKLQTAAVTIEFNNGKIINSQTDLPKGEPENSLNSKEFEERFLDLMQYSGHSLENGRKIIELCKDEDTNIVDLCKIL